MRADLRGIVQFDLVEAQWLEGVVSRQIQTVELLQDVDPAARDRTLAKMGRLRDRIRLAVAQLERD